MITRTKIVCTIGPAVESLEKILELLDAGMNVARLNFSHGTHEEHRLRIENLKKARKLRHRPLAIMLDTKGPEVRLGKLEGGQIALKAGQRLRLGEGGLPLHPSSILADVHVGARILFDDGYIISKVVEQSSSSMTVEIENDSILKSGKKVNFPGMKLNLPNLLPEDIEDLKFGCAMDVDYIAASFVNNPEHILEMKEILLNEGKSEILVIAKIESALGMENFDAIVQVADGIMIARGDLGVELEVSTVPRLQKEMIRKCYHACKPSVTATQMLESMIQNPRPTRAEVSDVANAIYDSSSSVMLSGETAVGRYPIETVRMMKMTVQHAEEDFRYRDFFELHSKRDYHDISSAVAVAALKTAYCANARAIFAFTTSGFTARQVSRLRPQMPIIAVTSLEKTYHQLAFNWGVIPVLAKGHDNWKEAFDAAAAKALEEGIIAFGDLVVVTAGSHFFGKKGSTNMMLVESIGDVVVRGHKGHGPKVAGQARIILSPEKHGSLKPDSVIVIPRCDETYLGLIKQSVGVVLQNQMDDSDSEKVALMAAKTFDVSVITRADSAMNFLTEGEWITLDPQRGLIFRGKE